MYLGSIWVTSNSIACALIPNFPSTKQPLPAIQTMITLPDHLTTDILSRLTTTTDIANSRLTFKTLNSLSYNLTSLNLLCSFNQYTHSRSQPSSTLNFKSNVAKLISGLFRLQSVSIGVDDTLKCLVYDDVEDDDNDDLYLSDEEFVSLWLPIVGGRLKCLFVTDFWVQSCWRISKVLALVSKCCQRLNELQIKRAWLSVDGLSVMSALTSLTLEFVRLDDENLLKLNECFPCLQTLNLLGVGGLKEPKICLKVLETCQWTVSNVPLSLTIVAPMMVKLKLKCVRPKSVVIGTPSLTDLDLSLEEAESLTPGELPHLKKLKLESSNLHSLIESFAQFSTVNELTLAAVNRNQLANSDLKVFDIFPQLQLFEYRS